MWHTIKAEEAAARLGTDINSGLSAHEAQERLATLGRNVIGGRRRRTAAGMLLSQFTDFMILVLIGAAVVSGIVGEAVDTIAIVTIVVLNAVIGFVQEYRAERSLEALKEMSEPWSAVIRGGTRLEVPVSEVVPGDLVLLEAGRTVPADLRIAESVMLKLDEAALTGESLPVDKAAAPLTDPDAPIGDRFDMAFKGTSVSFGRGMGIAVATGMQTELGRIATLLAQEKEDKTPLQKRLADFGRKLSIGALAVCAIVFVVGLLRGEPPVLMFLTAVSLAVAAIPEALPAVVTVSLAMGASKMVKKNVLVRRLSAVETLGSVTYICTDKTGTLTEGRMRTELFYADGEARRGKPDGQGPGVEMLLTSMALSNDAARAGAGEIKGDPTEAALLMAAEEAGYSKAALEAKFPRVGEVPFDAERKLMSTLHKDPDGGYLLITKGALESVLERSDYSIGPSGPGPLDSASTLAAGEDAAGQGYRVLAYGFRRMETMPEELGPGDEHGLVFTGFAGLVDPPRAEAVGAVTDCRTAGIKVVMITGDHPATAARIATELAIEGKGCRVVHGSELAAMQAGELEDAARRACVYARVAPEQKLKIVQALQSEGEFVAMTGDGVNDAPALKRADIGVSMGITGTDVSKEAADVVLIDDNFASIVGAVREGRRIYDNVRKFIKFMMGSNSGEIWTLFLAPFFGLPLPLLPVQILWVNLVTDGLPALSLAAEPSDSDVMRRPPRPPSESIFAHGLGYHIVWVGLLMGGVCISLEAWAYTTGRTHWQTMVFTALCMLQMGHVLAVRSERKSFFTQGPFTNLPLLGSVAAVFGLQMAVVYLPALNRVFKTQPLSGVELAVTLAASTAVFIGVEIEKALRRRRG